MNKEQLKIIEQQLTEKYPYVVDNRIGLNDAIKEKIQQQQPFNHEDLDYFYDEACRKNALEEIEIALELEYYLGFSDAFAKAVTKESYYLKGEEKRQTKIAVLMFGFGVLAMLLDGIFMKEQPTIIFVSLSIACWVFIWAAVEKYFFDVKMLEKRRLVLIQLTQASLAILK